MPVVPPYRRTIQHAGGMNPGRRPSTAPSIDRVIDRFRNWPLRACRPDSPPGRALALPGRQIAHVHQGDLVEVLLTRPVIARISTALMTSGRVDVPPHGDWIQIHLDTENDLLLMESLLSLAIQANDPALWTPCQAVAVCPYTGGTRSRRTGTSGPAPVTPGPPGRSDRSGTSGRSVRRGLLAR